MKRSTIRAALLAAIAIASLTAGSQSWAHRARVHFGVTLGYPGWYYPGPYVYPPAYPWYDPYYYHYPAPAYAAGPTTYIEQSAQPAPAPAPQAHWWYYCEGAKAYYPYVRECAGGWQRVSPTPPQGQ